MAAFLVPKINGRSRIRTGVHWIASQTPIPHGYHADNIKLLSYETMKNHGTTSIASRNHQSFFMDI